MTLSLVAFVSALGFASACSDGSSRSRPSHSSAAVAENSGTPAAPPVAPAAPPAGPTTPVPVIKDTVKPTKTSSGTNSEAKTSVETYIPTNPDPEPEHIDDPTPKLPLEEPLPPVKENEITTIAAAPKPTLKHMIFETSDKTEEGRYKSEFLLVLTAREKSCIRLKIRPTTGILYEVDSAAGGDPLADFACTADKQKVEAGPVAPTQSTGMSGVQDYLNSLKGGTTSATKTDTATTTAPAPSLNFGISSSGGTSKSKPPPQALCSSRVFFMPAEARKQMDDAFGLGAVSRKSGRLVAKSDGGHVQVWLDAEVGNLCYGIPQDPGKEKLDGAHIPKISLALGRYANYAGTKDHLTIEHFRNLANDGERMYAALTGKYGKVSDVDQNDHVDIFVTPDVNRLYFANHETKKHDFFRAGLVYKPEDLASYDSTKNPTSNEGEIIYLWTFDPGGLYGGVKSANRFPTANSLTSNYAKGYIAAQMMTLIMENAHLIKRPGPPEQPWLITSLSMLASSYMAGNDFATDYLSEYLSFRHQYLSLTEPVEMKDVKKNFQHNVIDAQVGYRALFGWYLHLKLCGPSLAMCDKLKEVIDTDAVGIANLEAVTKLSFDKLLQHYAASVGTAFAENAVSIRSGWKESVGLKPLELPAVAPLKPVGVIPITLENDRYGDVVAPGFDNSQPRVDIGNTDPAFAGPIPSFDHLIYQPVLPDNDLDLTLAKNSVTYIVLTGLLQQRTDMSVYLGANLSAYVVPLGERDSDKRQFHVEKVSESAHLDLRPANLTQTVDRGANSDGYHSRTYYDEPIYSDDVDFTVSPDRQLWILGSIDNIVVNEVTGEKTQSKTIGDTDSFNIAIDPCPMANDAEKQKCLTEGTNRVIVQLLPRDFDKELDPTLLVTSTSLDLFRGRVNMPKVDRISSEQMRDYDHPEEIIDTCQSEATVRPDSTGTGTEVHTYADRIRSAGRCANGGVRAKEYKDKLIEEGVCWSTANGPKCPAAVATQSQAFGLYTYLVMRDQDRERDPSATDLHEGPLYDNYLHSGPKGFPFHNNNTITYKIPLVRTGARPFATEEIVRQFFDYSYDKKPEFFSFRYFPVWAGLNFKPEFDLSTKVISIMSTELKSLLDLRNYLKKPEPEPQPPEDGTGTDVSLTTATDLKPAPEKATATSQCLALQIPGGGIDEAICKEPHLNWAVIESQIQRYLQDRRIVCRLSKDSLNTIAAAIDAASTPAAKEKAKNDGLQNVCSGVLLARSEVRGACHETTHCCPDADPTCANAAPTMSPWVEEKKLVFMVDPSTRVFGASVYDTNNIYETYYHPVFPLDELGNFCTGDRQKAGTEKPELCRIEDKTYGTGDLRYQFNVPRNLFTNFCQDMFYERDFLVCADLFSYNTALEPDKLLGSVFARESIPGERVRSFPLSMDNRVGEIIGKQKQLLYSVFKVGPAATPNSPHTIIHVMVGGLGKSQGKYMVRVRVKHFDLKSVE